MRLLICVLLATTPALADGKKPAKAKPPQLLVEMQASYAKAQHLVGSFTQTITRQIGKPDLSTGTLYLARPDKMRWEYIDKKGKPKRDMIYDGKTLWSVEHQNTKIYQYTTVSPTLPAAVSFLTSGDKLTDEFTVTSPAADTLELVPKQVSAKVKKLTFVVDPKTKQVVRSIVLDHNDDTNTFEFTKVDLATKPDAKKFQFSPKDKPAFEVVKLAD
jgi:chaperone LolA